MACPHSIRAGARPLRWLSAIVLVAGLGGSLASARAAGPAPGPAPNRADFAKACAQGNRQYAARDFAAAINTYQGAIAIRPQDPLGYLLLGEAQLAAGQPAEAEAAWTRASAASASDAAMHGRVLFVLADLAERGKNWAEAKVRWTAYRTWAEQSRAAQTFVASADARIQAIDRALAQDKDYEAVRQRIAETQDGGVFTDLGSAAADAGSAPAPAK
jgi:tetratricopeptide (TPR) repeat protein